MIAGIQPQVQAISMCDAAKTEMKEMNSGEIGSWKRQSPLLMVAGSLAAFPVTMPPSL